MPTIPWEEVREVVDAVLDLPPEQRSPYLDRACPDSSVRRYVDSLILSFDQAGDFLDEPVIAIHSEVPPSPAASLTGKRVGAYQIVSEIGRGGMGEVYCAVRADDQYRKEVAIKLIRAGRESNLVIARFKNERQILAGLEHPNIARLLDGGATPEGIPYFVMELIEGDSIIEYCNRRALDIRTRLNLFLDVCSAVQFAHQRLIIHRDIKPGNILVTSEGIPKLLDFGIAKIVDKDVETGRSEPTLTIFHALTPAYASPEQIKGGPLTTASDVYSLAVVLYELLAGLHPYHRVKGSPQEIAQAVCELEPEKPSTAALSSGREHRGKPSPASIKGVPFVGVEKERLSRSLRGDLDNIVLMALRKEPERRYASAEKFAEDLRRHISNLPVVARKDTARYRAAKFALRHKAGASATAVVVLTLLIAFVITLREVRIAQRRFNDVRQLANSLVFDIHDSIKDLSGATAARQLLTQKASQYLDGLAKESGNDVSLQRELANAYERLGMVQGEAGQSNQGDTAGALQSYRKAQAIEEKISARGDNQDRLRYAQSYSNIARLQWSAGDAANALKSGQKAVEMLQAISQREPDNPEVLTALAANYAYVADLIPTTSERSGLSGGANEVIEDYYRRALEIDEKLASKSSDPKQRRSLEVNEQYLGRHLNELGLWQEALEVFGKAQANIQSIVASAGSTNKLQRDLAVLYGFAGDAYLSGGRSIEALTNYQEAGKIFSARVEADAHDDDARLLFALAQLNVGNALRKLGRYPEALAHLQTGRGILNELVGKDPVNLVLRPVLATGARWSAQTLLAQGSLGAASEHFSKAIALASAAAQAEPGDLDAQSTLAIILATRGDFFQAREQALLAEDDYRQAIRICEGLLTKAPDNSELRSILANSYLGLSQIHLSRSEKNRTLSQSRISTSEEAKSLAERGAQYFREIPHPVLVTRNGLDSITSTDVERVLSLPPSGSR